MHTACTYREHGRYRFLNQYPPNRCYVWTVRVHCAGGQVLDVTSSESLPCPLSRAQRYRVGSTTLYSAVLSCVVSCCAVSCCTVYCIVLCAVMRAHINTSLWCVVAMVSICLCMCEQSCKSPIIPIRRSGVPLKRRAQCY